MPFRRSFKLSLLVFLLSLYQGLFSQCIDTGEFDSGPCDSCAPPGWDNIWASEIDEIGALSWCPNLTESPTGGTMVDLNIIGSTNTEGIETTIDGLTPGVEYSLSFWWIACDLSWTSDALLVIDVDGEEYTFDSEFEWQLSTICVVAEEETMDIIVTGESLGTQSELMIDDALCSEVEPCCPLIAELEEEISLCPDEEVELDLFIDQETGQVEYEWISIPSDGLNYLSATDIQDPIFNYPGPDIPFEGAEYIYEVTATDEECAAVKRITVTVGPIDELTFEFTEEIICEQEGTFIFPSVSDQGVSGSWETEQINLLDQGGSFDNVFTPSSSSAECPIPYPFSLQIENFKVAEFELPGSYCSGSDSSFLLPEDSDNNIEGYWNESEIDPMNMMPGDYAYIFTPYDEFCREGFIWEFEIEDYDLIQFNLPDTICKTKLPFQLPDESMNNIDGSWEPQILDNINGEDSLFSKFIPDGDNCYNDVSRWFYFSEKLSPEFKLDSILCKSSLEVQLDSMSLGGIQGAWNIPLFNPDTISQDSLLLIWTPIDTSSCIDQYDWVLRLKNPVSPIFNLPSELCASDQIFELPQKSENEIEGEWSLSSFIPEDYVNQILELTYEPLPGQCAEDYNFQIEILDKIIPSFSIIESLCEGDSIYQFPSVSIEGITGNWEFNSVDPQNWNFSTIENTFYPDDLDCADPVLVSIDLIQRIEPIFSFPLKYCFDDTTLELPTVSDNDIEGEWSQQFVNPSSDPQLQDLVFIPTDTYCYSPIILKAEIVGPFDIQLLVEELSDCNTLDGALTINSLEQDVEYSIDNGIFWTTDNEFQNLNSGVYELRVRSTKNLECVQLFDFEITSPSNPQITELIIQDVKNCVSPNGAIQIVGGDDNYEYSIDEGASWQNDEIFGNLAEGSYVLMIRDENSIDCITEMPFELGAVALPEIIRIDATDPSDCEENDGSISIEADGIDLSYSIDGGLTFQQGSVFDMLAGGEYTVVVIENAGRNCEVISEINLIVPQAPSDILIDIHQPYECLPESGTITINAPGSQLEYSIDAGSTWSMSNIFENLVAGEYSIQIKSALFPNCVSDIEEVVLLFQENLFDNLNDVIIDSPVECDFKGRLEIIAEGIELEYSIDGGLNWQDEIIFENLDEGNYSLIGKMLEYPYCEELITEFEIEILPCTCPDLEYDVDIQNIFCSDETAGSIQLSNIIGFKDMINSIEWSDQSNDLGITQLTGGIYSVTIDYDTDCIWTDNFIVEQSFPIEFLAVPNELSCPDSENGSIEILDVSGGSGNYSFAIDNLQFQEEQLFENLSAGQYQIFVTDEFGCQSTQDIEIFYQDIIEIDLPETIKIEQGEVVKLDPQIDISQIDSFTWSPSNVLTNPFSLNAEAIIDETTDLELTIYYDDCVNTRTVRVEIISTDEVYVGNIFNPSSFENNRVFIQSNNGAGIQLGSFRIYDRWGNLVFENSSPALNEPDSGWDGRIEGELADPAVFVYQIEYQIEGQIKYTFGSITLTR